MKFKFLRPFSHAPRLLSWVTISICWHKNIVSVLTGARIQLHLGLHIESAAAEEQERHEAERAYQEQQPCQQAHTKHAEHHRASFPATKYTLLSIPRIHAL